MKLILKIGLFATFCACDVSPAIGDPFFAPPKQVPPTPYYDLYSWKTSAAGWNFSVSRDTGVPKDLATVTDPKTALHGTRELKEKLAAIPRGATVFWCEQQGAIRQTKPSIILLPDRKTILDIFAFAKAHQLNIEVYFEGHYYSSMAERISAAKYR